MRVYDPDTFTFGYELEVGDVPKSVGLPPELGAWEYSERDIVNLIEPWRHVAADPLGIAPPVGGEVNIAPGRTPEEVANRVRQVINYLREQSGVHPTFCCTTHGHVHVRVPGLRGEIEDLKRLTAYIRRWQATVVAECGRFREHPDMRKCPGSISYMRYDGGRLMPDWMCENIITMARDFDHLIELQCCGKDGVSRGRPFRFAVNTYCMKHIDTIEFRMFRSTGNYHQVLDTIAFARAFLVDALSESPIGVGAILSERSWDFPEMRFDAQEWLGLQATKHPEGRGSKQRRLLDV